MREFFKYPRLFLLIGVLIAAGPVVGQEVSTSNPAQNLALPNSPVPPPIVPQPAAVPRLWFRTESLLWWSKSGPLSAPLVTQGSVTDTTPGALGEPGTQVLYGDRGIDYRLQSGFRFESGLWLNAEQTFAIESGFFLLGGRARRFSAYSDDSGDPVIARPTIDALSATEYSYLDSYPGALAGGIAIASSSQFAGWDIDAAVNFARTEHLRWDGLLGFRFLHLSESLRIEDQVSPLVDGAVTFLSDPVDTSSSLMDIDRFRTVNNFYGGQLGTRLSWLGGRWVIDATGKLALGTSRERTVIRGSTAMFSPDGSVTYIPGGLLATSANIGNYSRNAFAVAPEAGLNVGFHITPRIMARVGYSFIYWSNVLRPGNLVSRVVSPNLVPSDPNYGTAGPNQPAYQPSASSYWAQGLNLGLEFDF